MMNDNNFLNSLSPIEEIINDARNGKMFILVDEADRKMKEMSFYLLKWLLLKQLILWLSMVGD